jgi:hypothetical protein
MPISGAGQNIFFGGAAGADGTSSLKLAASAIQEVTAAEQLVKPGLCWFT